MKQLFNSSRISKSQVIKFQDLREFVVGDTFACTVLTGSENSAVLLALRWYMIFQIIQYLISRDNYTRCHMTLLAKMPKKMLKVYQTLLPATGWGLGTRLRYIYIRGGWTRKCVTITCIKAGAPAPYTNIWHIWV